MIRTYRLRWLIYLKCFDDVIVTPLYFFLEKKLRTRKKIQEHNINKIYQKEPKKLAA